MKNFGRLLRELRKRRGLKIYELAQKVDVQPEFITQVEKGRKLPSEKVLVKIAKVLDVDVKPYYYIEKHPALVEYLDKKVFGRIKYKDIVMTKIVTKGKMKPLLLIPK